MGNRNTISARAVTQAALFAAGVTAALALVWLVFGTGSQEAPVGGTSAAVLEPLQLETQSGRHALQVEVARSPEQQALGLMYRTELAPDRGMLFIHEPEREASMWMKNTYIPLDMVFINSDGTVHSIEAMTEPHSEALITSGIPVRAVLEIAGGAAARYQLKAGDKVHHAIFDRR